MKSVQELMVILLTVSKLIADKVKSGEWSGRFRRTTKETLMAHTEAIETIGEGMEASAEIQAQMFLKMQALERRLSEVESR